MFLKNSDRYQGYFQINTSVIFHFFSHFPMHGQSIRYSRSCLFTGLMNNQHVASTIQDMTCDSDGKIDNFISTRNNSHYLPVHPLKQKEPYYLGVFLVGAYQEILGDLHNLFGDTNAVHVSVDEDGYKIDQVIDGETIAEVLEYVQYNPKKMVRTVESWVTSSVKAGIITLEEGREFLSNYRSGLYGYTYLE